MFEKCIYQVYNLVSKSINDSKLYNKFIITQCELLITYYTHGTLCSVIIKMS